MFNHALDILKIEIETPKKRKLEDSWTATKKKKTKLATNLITAFLPKTFIKKMSIQENSNLHTSKKCKVYLAS